MTAFDILCIKALGNVTLCQEDRSNPSQPVWETIPPQDPLWQDGQYLHPAAFAMNDEQPSRLEVTVRFQEQPARGTYTLTGHYPEDKDLFTFSGRSLVDGSCTEVVFDVCSQFAVTDFLAMKGNFYWSLTRKDIKETPDDHITSLEFYWLYDNPQAADPSLFSKGVPVEILQDVTGAIRVNLGTQASLRPPPKDRSTPENAEKDQVIEVVVDACFVRNPPLYNIYDGTYNFIFPNGYDNITVRLKKYWQALSLDLDSYPYPYCCNCEDLAAVLQVYLKAIGIADVKYCVMNPFGYLRVTNLVGRGFSNNPKFKDQEEEPIFGQKGMPIVEEMSGFRTYFNRHAFCCLVDAGSANPCEACQHQCRIVDACVGPHVGGETMAEYVEHAVDNIYPAENGKPGTEDNITCYDGVMHIDYIEGVEKEPEFPLVVEFKEIVGFQPGIKEELEKYFVKRSWPDPKKSRVLGKRGWHLFYQDLLPGSGEVLKTWTFRKIAENVTVDLYVSSGNNEYSLNRFLSLGTSTTMDKIPFKKGPSYLGQLSACIETEYHSRYLWVFHNLVFDVALTNVTFKPERLLKRLNRKARCKWYIKKFTADNLRKYLPPTHGIRLRVNEKPVDGDKIEVTVGERVMVSLPPHEDLLYDFTFEKGKVGLRYIGRTKEGFGFHAHRESENEQVLVITVVNKKTFMSASKKFCITIKKHGNA